MKLLLIILLILGAVIYFLYEKNRSDALENASRQLMFSLERGQQKLPAELDQAGFYLFTQGAPAVQNLMRGERDGYRIVLAEFFYDAAFGEEGDRNLPNSDNDSIVERRAQMFAWVQSSDFRLPQFDLSPVNSPIRGAARNSGYQPMQFDDAEQFNKTFNLAGNDPQSLRALFDENLRNYLLQKPDLVWESQGDQWLFYIDNDRLDASDLDNFIDYIVQLLIQSSS